MIDNMTLPSSVYAEKLILGCLLLGQDDFAVCSRLAPEDFAIQKHRTIFTRMREMNEAGVSIDHVTLAERLMRKGEMELVDGLTGIVELEEGLPEIYNLGAYVGIVLEKSKLRKIIHAAEEAQNAAFLASETPDTIIRGMIGSVEDIADNEVADGLMSVAEIIDRMPGGLDGLLHGKSLQSGIKTGFSKLDMRIGGMDPGQLIIVAGRPGMGKTAFASNIAENVALGRDPATVAIFSLEMSREENLQRLLASNANADLQKIRCNYLDDEERGRLAQSGARFYESALLLDDSAAISLSAIKLKLKRLVSGIERDGRPPLKLVIVDYIQLMPVTNKKNGNREQEIAALSRGLKLLAKKFRVPVIAMSQLNRAVDLRGNHEPQLSDLRESGAIEQDADVVLFPYRPEVYCPDREDMRGVAKLIIAKQRNGPTGFVDLVWFAQFTKFVDAVEEWREEN
jgi:replicative DNA helicase